MKIHTIEIGSKSEKDTQYKVEFFNGTLENYLNDNIEEINKRPDLTLIDFSLLSGNTTALLQYYCGPMGKIITSYSTIIEE